MKIEVTKNDTTVDAKVLCDNTYTATVVESERKPAYRNNRCTGDNAFVKLECGEYVVSLSMFDVDGWGGFDANQYLKLEDHLASKQFVITFGRCSNGKPFIKEARKVAK